jgi:hypothetical protein
VLGNATGGEVWLAAILAAPRERSYVVEMLNVA